MLTIHLYCDNVILHYIRTEFILKIALQSFVYWFGIFIACKKKKYMFISKHISDPGTN